MSSRVLTRILRLVVGLSIIAWLLRHAPLSALAETLGQAFSRPGWLLSGIGLTFLGLLMGVVRWNVMLIAQGLHVRSSQVFRVFFIGQFFNAFMPGACGGDVARAYYAARDFPGRRTEAASTVFMDRAIGLFATILWCCAVIALRLPFFLVHAETKKPGLLMLIFLLAAIIGTVALFRRNLFEHLALFRRMERIQPIGPAIRRAYDALYLYRLHHVPVLAAMGFSLLNLLFLAMACCHFGFALDINMPRPLVNHLTLFPIVTTLAAIPITPGALGLREGLFAGMYGALDVEPVQAISLSLLVYAGGLLWSLLGGIFFIQHTTAEHRGVREELQALRPSADEPDPAARD